MEVNALLIAAFVAILVFLAYMGITAYIEKTKVSKELSNRLRENADYASSDPHHVYSDSLKTSTGASGEDSSTLEMCRNLVKMTGGSIEKAKKTIGPRLLMAGYRGEAPLVYYLFFKRIASVFITFIAFVILLQVENPQDDLLALVSGLILLVIGLFGPFIFLENAVQKQKQAITRAFPDTLDLILVCIQSGLALDASLARVTKELGTTYKEMTKELERMRLEFSMLDDRTRALTNFAERTDVACIRSLVAALVQSEKFGTSLSEALRVLAEDYRVQRLNYAEQKAGKIPVIVTIPTIFMMLPALFIIILGPTIIRTLDGDGGLSQIGEELP